VYDELWRQVEFDVYSERRMKNLLISTSNQFVRSIEKQLSNMNFWLESKDSSHVREQLRQSIHICEQWTTTVEQLTSVDWRRYNPHPWKGEPCRSFALTQLNKRLNDILSIRSSYEQSRRFTTDREKLSAANVFASFAHLNPLECNADADTQWRLARNQFEMHMATTDKDIARQLRDHFQRIRSNPQQMLVDFKYFIDLIQSTNIRKELAPELEFLLGQLESDIRKLTDEFNNLTKGRIGGGSTKTSFTRGVNRTTIAALLDASRQIETKVYEDD
jgi:hypothetical protein